MHIFHSDIIFICTFYVVCCCAAAAAGPRTQPLLVLLHTTTTTTSAVATCCCSSFRSGKFPYFISFYFCSYLLPPPTRRINLDIIFASFAMLMCWLDIDGDDTVSGSVWLLLPVSGCCIYCCGRCLLLALSLLLFCVLLLLCPFLFASYSSFVCVVCATSIRTLQHRFSVTRILSSCYTVLTPSTARVLHGYSGMDISIGTRVTHRWHTFSAWILIRAGRTLPPSFACCCFFLLYPRALDGGIRFQHTLVVF